MKKRLNHIADSWGVSLAFLIGSCCVAIGAIAIICALYWITYFWTGGID